MSTKYEVHHNPDKRLPERGMMFAHCAKCLEERPADVSARDWARLSVGWTTNGIQIYCVRHELNVDDAVIKTKGE